MQVGAIAASAGAAFSGQQSYNGELGPLTDAKRLEQLLLGVFNGKRDGVNGGDWQSPPLGCEWLSSKVLRITPRIKIKSIRADAYSYRRASTGSSLEARKAGTKPLATPTRSSTALERITVIMEIRR